ncbi:MAG: alpha/beta fold hydrolase [Butyricimonas faecihominis]
MDSRGHGASELKEGAAQELTTREMADDVMQVMDVLNVPKAVILGFSDGANVALEAASRYPDRVLAVAAVSGNALPRGMSWLFYGEVQAEVSGPVLDGEMLPMSGEVKESSIKTASLNGLMAQWPRLGKTELSLIKAPVLLLTAPLT